MFEELQHVSVDELALAKEDLGVDMTCPFGEILHSRNERCDIVDDVTVRGDSINLELAPYA